MITTRIRAAPKLSGSSPARKPRPNIDKEIEAELKAIERELARYDKFRQEGVI